jgi:quercetin dioxygenase-like cupin family protein
VRQIEMTPQVFDDARFVGHARGADIIPDPQGRLHVYVVTYAPKGRTAWHSHAEGQLLIAAAGEGMVGFRNGLQLALRPGLAVWTDPHEEHWHGGSATSECTQVAIQTRPAEGEETSWGEAIGSVIPR